MKRYEKIFEDTMGFSSVRPVDHISETEKHFFYQCMKESARQAWRCFNSRAGVYFEKWWEEENGSNERPEGFKDI